MTLQEYLQNPYALDPDVSLYLAATKHELGRTLFSDKDLPSVPVHKAKRNNWHSESELLVVKRTDFRPPKNIPDQLKILYHNNALQHTSGKLKALPMGRDYRTRDALREIGYSSSKPKNGLLYSNFSTNTHRSRFHTFSQLKSLRFGLIEHGGKHLEYPISRIEFLETMYSHKFVACPRGNGRDTFRFWDALCGGSVPLVSAGTQPKWNLPFLEVQEDQWGQLDEHQLNSIWHRMLKTTYNFDLLTLDDWKLKIKREMQDLVNLREQLNKDRASSSDS